MGMRCAVVRLVDPSPCKGSEPGFGLASNRRSERASQLRTTSMARESLLRGRRQPCSFGGVRAQAFQRCSNWACQHKPADAVFPPANPISPTVSPG